MPPLVPPQNGPRFVGSVGCRSVHWLCGPRSPHPAQPVTADLPDQGGAGNADKAPPASLAVEESRSQDRSHVPSLPGLSRDAIPRWAVLLIDPASVLMIFGVMQEIVTGHWCSGSFLQRSEERTNFVVDLVRVIDGGGDLLAKQDAVSAAKAMDGDSDRPFARAQPKRDRRV
jgi:hypothetical protein